MTDTRFPTHVALEEPALRFGPDPSAVDVHPLRGLVQFGPYSQGVLDQFLPTIRCAAVFPHGELDALQTLVKEFWSSHEPVERVEYLPPFPGFRQVYGIDITGAGKHCQIELPADLDARLVASAQPHRVLAEEITRALMQLATAPTDFDVVLIYLPARWGAGFTGPEGDDFDLHDHIKSVAASRNIATQLLNEQRALQYPCRASVMWRLSIALYVKAGGVPWKLADVEPDTAFIGLGYAVRKSETDQGRFVTCCSQVFDADGSGLEFLVYRPEEAFRGRNPYLTREQMRTIMFRSKALFQHRHAGQLPSRVVIHKNNDWRPDEIDGCFDAFGDGVDVELVNIQQRVGWRGVLINSNPTRNKTRGVPNSYPVLRGTVVQLGGHEALIWTQGNAPSAVDGRNYFKEGRGIPRPLLAIRSAGYGPLERTCAEVLKLTKMNWNNDALYDFLPTTLDLAHTLAETAKRMPSLRADAYPYRLFM